VSDDVGVQMRGHLQEVEDRNADTLDLVAARMHQVIVDDGLILTTGTGHSLAMVLETFYRAGGLACVLPVTHPALFPLEGGSASTLLERVPGLGGLLVEAARPTARDMAFVFSNSGTNPVPVEIALAMRETGTTVVAVSSYEHMSRAPTRASAKLGEVADHVLDTAAPYGDAFIPTDDGPTAALSSLAGVYLWNLLLARLARLAAAAGTSLPIWVSANVSGGDDRNRALRTRYGERIPML
jgi:uncharacterized phosphosugar-binding protein